jgi:hypothetical protein
MKRDPDDMTRAEIDARWHEHEKVPLDRFVLDKGLPELPEADYVDAGVSYWYWTTHMKWLKAVLDEWRDQVEAERLRIEAERRRYERAYQAKNKGE